MKFDPNAMPIMQVGISGDLDASLMTQITEERIIPKLERLSGVGQVTLTGGEEKEIQVIPDLDVLQQYGISMSQFAQLIGAENMSAPAGQIEVNQGEEQGTEQMPLRVIGEFQSLDDIRNVNIPLQTGEVLKVKDIATVEEVVIENTSFAYINGHPTISLDIMKQSDANTVDVSDAVLREIEEIEESLGYDLSLSVIMDSALFIRESINNVAFNMVIGGAMAVLVLLFFLRSIRSTVIIGLSIPIALISAFLLIYFSGETINILTLGGLALGIGLLVDSSIVILENIFKYREKGLSALEAAKQGAQEVAAPVIASTLTSIVVFVPIIFTGGFAAELFMPLALTVGFILFASLIVSLTVVPMLSRLLLPELKQAEKANGFRRLGAGIGRAIHSLTAGYRKLLHWAINHRKTIIFTTLVLLIGSVALIPLIGVEFIPDFDQGELMATFELPPGTPLIDVREKLEQVESYLLDTDATELVYTTIGGGTMMGGAVTSQESGNIYVRLVPQSERSITTNQLIEDLTDFAKTVPEFELEVTAFQSGGFGDSPIEVQIRGTEIDQLKQIADELQETIGTVQGVVNVSHSMGETRPEMQLYVDKDAALAYGLVYPDILQTVMNTMDGQVATLIRRDGQEYNVRVILPEEYRTDVSQLEDLPLMTPLGMSIPLGEVASFVQGEGPNMITRENQSRGVSITGDVMGRDLTEVIQEIEDILEQYEFPEGYDYQIGGEYETMMETFGDLTLALLLAVFLVYAVMAFQFEKVMYPFIVMFSVPVTAIGVIVGFLITGRPFSAPAFIGMIMLAGIVVNNAIVLVDFINVLRKRGMPLEEAILEAGQQRLRPILMTMLTTVLAMVPLAIGFGEGSELQAPMATVIVFGLSFSTLITLFLIPVMYIYMDRLTNWWKRLFSRKSAQEKRV